MKVIAGACFAIFVCAGMGFAQPSFDCAKAQGSVEELICADAKLATLDLGMANRYQAALAAAGGLEVGGQSAGDDLKAMQRGWIKGRDECWKADALRDCVEFAYQSREAELVTRWMLEEPVSTVFWTCEGNPANEVVTMFFETSLPSIRFEHGDSIDTGLQVRTASGAKYVGSFGRSIWMKGDMAMYRAPDPSGVELSCTKKP
ncbi:MAG: lysozyme inhibitor LprI family protein [Pseudomonadota bacterium]